MSSRLIVPIITAMGSLLVGAQLTMLTLREAEALIESIPEVVAAGRNGECPGLSPLFEGPEEISFLVRRECGAARGQLIDNYKVNRRTGEVVQGWDNPRSVLDAEGRKLAIRSIELARLRVLSTAEARCVAREAARARPGWNDPAGVVSVQSFGEANRLEGTQQFTSMLVLQTQPVTIGAMLTVNLRNASVRDDQTGVPLMSESLGLLTQRLYALREPVWLTDIDVASVAIAIPRVAKNLGAGCKLNVGGAFYSRQALLGVACGERYLRESNVLVDLATGTVTDPETGGPLESLDADRVAKKLLAEVRDRRKRLQAEIFEICRP